jgi:DNA-binding FadR family transcriptional regulator
MATGAIAPGQRLPTERTLAAQSHASRGSLREAIGVFVTVNCRELARDSFTSLLPLGQYRFEQSLEFRKLIEPRAAEMAARRATEDRHTTLHKSLTMVDEHPSPEMFVESNRLFHATIAEATGDPYLQGFLHQFFATQDMSSAARTAGPIQRRSRSSSMRGSPTRSCSGTRRRPAPGWTPISRSSRATFGRAAS